MRLPFFEDLDFEVTQDHQQLLSELLQSLDVEQAWQSAKPILADYPPLLSSLFYDQVSVKRLFSTWLPDEYTRESNISRLLQHFGLSSYQDLYALSIKDQESYWSKIIDELGIAFVHQPSSILDPTSVENPNWLKGAKLNIVESILKKPSTTNALAWMDEESEAINSLTYGELKATVQKFASGLQNLGLQKGDRIAFYCPMNEHSVPLYLATVLAGMVVVSIPDSFPLDEVQKRLDIAPCKLIVTVNHYQYGGKQINVLSKLAPIEFEHRFLLLQNESDPKHLSLVDLDGTENFTPVICDPQDTTNILFSSGTTSAPKAIPWTHITPIKSAGDGFTHHDIQTGDVITWTTGMGWMMAPWLIYSSLLNGATMAFFKGSAAHPNFGFFVQEARINMLGTIPSLVSVWEKTGAMETYDWNIRVFSSTGEPSNPASYQYLSYLGKHKAPIIEYCGGTEIGGGYVTSSILLPNYLSHFNSPALGTQIVLLDSEKQEVINGHGEVFLVPPSFGSSERLLNKDHHEVYFANQPVLNDRALRKHGDALEKLRLDGISLYRSAGRTDDTMNLGGIKTSSVEIEEVLLQHKFIDECAAISVSNGGPEKLVVFLTRDADENLQKELQILIRSKLNPLFKISKVVTIDKLPRTASNKVMRRSLKSLA